MGVKLDQFVYMDVVKNVYHPDMEMMLGGKYVFMQDGAPAHTAKSVIKWFKDNKVPLLDWPASSPDLNPLDYAIWGILEKAVSDQQPKTEVELKCSIRKAVSQLPLSVIKKTVAQFEDRLKLCVENGGKQFEYKM